MHERELEDSLHLLHQRKEMEEKKRQIAKLKDRLQMEEVDGCEQRDRKLLYIVLLIQKIHYYFLCPTGNLTELSRRLTVSGKR